MNNDQAFNNKRIIELIEQSKKIAIIPSKIAGTDAFCAGVGLYYILKDHSKDVHFIYPGRLPENTNDLIEDNDITSDVKQSNLTIRIDYSGTDASQVHYATEDDVLTLTVSPIPNDFDKNDRITTGISGHEFDLMFIIGAQEKRDLGGTAKALEKQMDYAKHHQYQMIVVLELILFQRKNK